MNSGLPWRFSLYLFREAKRFYPQDSVDVAEEVLGPRIAISKSQGSVALVNNPQGLKIFARYQCRNYDEHFGAGVTLKYCALVS